MCEDEKRAQVVCVCEREREREGERKRERERESSTSFTVGPHALSREQIDTKSISPFNRRQQHHLSFCEGCGFPRTNICPRKGGERFRELWVSVALCTRDKHYREHARARAARRVHAHLTRIPAHAGVNAREGIRVQRKMHDRYQCLLGVAFARCQVSLQGVVATKSLLVRQQRRAPERERR